ncbi:MAG: hypothetical protein OXF45_05850 [Candidatus Dadabacteria bacterium]|nr:hypothetical protein [Candidatus Dadabacteria bacterium]
MADTRKTAANAARSFFITVVPNLRYANSNHGALRPVRFHMPVSVGVKPL